jgi:predicted AAA+ superfamily ATPase
MESFYRHFQRYFYFPTNVNGEVSIDIFIFRKECGKIKCLWKVSTDISIDIFIFPHSFPQMSMGNFPKTFLFMESFYRHFQRYFYFPTNVNGEVSIDIFIFRKECGKIKCLWKVSTDISIDIFIFPYSFPQMSMGNFP